MASEVKTNKVSPATGSTTEVTGLITSTSDARGDVLYHDGTNFTRLAKPGTPADELLTFATGASDPAWVAAAAGGKVLQVIGHTWKTTSSTTSSTMSLVTDSGTIITPSATTSKILITGYVSCDVTGSNHIGFKLYDGTSEITGASGDAGSSKNEMVGGNGGDYSVAGMMALPFAFLYESLTTSATTINLYFAGGTTSYVNRNHGNTTEGYSSQITLMEIGA